MKPPSVLGYVSIYLLCDSTFFFMKVPFDMSGPTLRTSSVPHSLLLYSVHVKWILICVQNVDKDENTLDYILCTYLCGVVIPRQNSPSFIVSDGLCSNIGKINSIERNLEQSNYVEGVVFLSGFVVKNQTKHNHSNYSKDTINI